MPILTMVVGIPGAGKSTHVDALLQERSCRVLNQDHYGLAFPACRDQRDAELASALEAGEDFLLDWTGTGSSALEWSQKAIDRGFALEVLFVECALEEALRRVRLRNAQGGRQVSEDAIRRCHAELWRVEALEAIATRFVRVQSRPPSTAGDGEGAR